MGHEIVARSGSSYWSISDAAETSGLRYSSTWGATGGGCLVASWRTDPPSGSLPAWLTRGTHIEVRFGPAMVWSGFLTEAHPEAGSWSFAAKGYAAAGARQVALDSTGRPTSNPRTAVTEAIADGLPWTGASALPNVPLIDDEPQVGGSPSEANLEPMPLLDLLDAYAEHDGKRWGIFADQAVTYAADPTTPTWLVRGASPMVSVADDNYVTHLSIRFLLLTQAMLDAGPDPNDPYSVDPVISFTTVGDSSVPYLDRRWEFLDLVPMETPFASQAAAQAVGEARLTTAGARDGWTEALTVTADDLFSFAGSPAHPATLEAGAMLRVEGLYGADQALDFTGYADIVIGEVEYDVDAEAARVAPVGFVPRDLRSLLTVAADPGWAAGRERRSRLAEALAEKNEWLAKLRTDRGITT